MKSKKKVCLQQSNPFNELELPEGWTLTKVRDLVTINYGKGLKEADRAGGSVPVYGSNGVVGLHNKALTNGPSIIIGRKGSIGEVHYSANPSWPIDTTYYIDKFEGTDQTFLVFALKLLNLSNLDTSTAIPGLNRDDIYDQQIPLPPLAEQQRIVARVEALLTHVNAARNRLSRVPLIMKRFRQAVLAAACSGRMTEGWREFSTIEETGIDLLQKIVESKQKKRSKNLKIYRDANQIETEYLAEIPEEWAWTTLDQITQNFDGQRIPIKSDDRQKRRGAYPYYGASGIIDTIDDFLFDGEFLLIGEDGANLVMRSTPIAFQAKGKFWVNNHAHILQTNGGIPLQFIEHYINSIDLQQYVTGSAQPKLTQTNMNIIPVPLPPLAEQHEIVRRVNALFERADTIEREVVAASRRCEGLTQAVLARAFRGELTRNDDESN